MSRFPQSLLALALIVPSWSCRADIPVVPAVYGLPADAPYSFAQIVDMSASAQRSLAAGGSAAAAAPGFDALAARIGMESRTLDSLAGADGPGPAVLPWSAQPAQQSVSPSSSGGSGAPVLPQPGRWLMMLSGLAIAAFITLRRANTVD